MTAKSNELTMEEMRALFAAKEAGRTFSEAEEYSFQTGLRAPPKPQKASLPKRMWLAWWTWSLGGLAALFLGALTHSGVVLVVLIVLAAMAGVYMLFQGTN